MLVSKVTGTTLSVWLPVFNLPFIALGYRQIGGGFAVRSALGHRRPLARRGAAALPRRHARSRAERGLRRLLPRRGHRSGGAWRRRARRHGDRRAPDQQAEPPAEGRRRDPALQRRPVPGRDDAARHRGGALLDPDLRRRGADARLRDPRHRGVHRDHHRVTSERRNRRAHPRESRPRRDRLQGARRPERRGQRDPLLRRHATRNRQGQDDRAEARSERVRDHACARRCRWAGW